MDFVANTHIKQYKYSDINISSDVLIYTLYLDKLRLSLQL